MNWAVTAISSVVDTPLCVDSADPAVLEAGLMAVGEGRALINSAKAGSKTLGEVVNLAARFKSPLVGIGNG